MRGFCKLVHDTSDARFGSYTNREAAEIAAKKWDALVDELQDLARPLAYDPNLGQPLLDENTRLREIEQRLKDDGLASQVAVAVDDGGPASGVAIDKYRAAVLGEKP